MKKVVYLALLALLASGCSKKEEEAILPEPEGTRELNLGEMRHEFVLENIEDLSGLGDICHLYVRYRITWTSPDYLRTTIKTELYYPAERGIYDDLPVYGIGTFDIDGICSVGEVKGLGNITKIPKTGFTNMVSYDVGFGYVIRYATPEIFNDSFVEHSRLKETYARMYVVERIVSNNAVTGVKVRYQYPFEP